jgi:hypothetical protein
VRDLIKVLVRGGVAGQFAEVVGGEAGTDGAGGRCQLGRLPGGWEGIVNLLGLSGVMSMV